MANSRYHNILIVADIFANVTLLILGMCLLGLGMAEKSTPVSALFSAESKIGTIASVMGLILIFSSVLNCCFAMSELSLLGHLYVAVLIALFVVSITATIIYGTHPENVMKQDVRMRMREMFRFRPNERNLTDFDTVQQTCCGIDSYKDWFYLTDTRTLPQSCCKVLECDTTNLSNIYEKSCLNLLMESTSSLLAKIIGAVIALSVFLPVQIIIVASLVIFFT